MCCGQTVRTATPSVCVCVYDENPSTPPARVPIASWYPSTIKKTISCVSIDHSTENNQQNLHLLANPYLETRNNLVGQVFRQNWLLQNYTQNTQKLRRAYLGLYRYCHANTRWVTPSTPYKRAPVCVHSLLVPAGDVQGLLRLALLELLAHHVSELLQFFSSNVLCEYICRIAFTWNFLNV